MEFEVVAGSIVEFPADAIVVNLFEGVTEPAGATAAADRALGGLIGEVIGAGEIKGKANETTLIHTQGKLPARRVLVVGLGKREEFDLLRARQASGAAASALAGKGCKQAATILHGAGAGGFAPVEAAQALAEGALLALHPADEFKSKREPAGLERLTVVEMRSEQVEPIREGLRRGEIAAGATNYARGLTNLPANRLTPTRLAEAAQEVASAHGLECEVIDRSQFAALGLGALEAVSRGSDEPAKLVILHHGKELPGPVIGLVGKGITFDSGGLDLKSADQMDRMKGDMAGAAAVLGAVRAIAQLGLRANVIAVIPATENLPGGRAFKPGDVLTSFSGKTIEVVSTDAEGRLILADALAYARKLGCTHLIDLATLTGACVIALGGVATGLVSNDDDFARAALEVSERAGERLWRMPLFPEYREQIESKLADLKNTGGRPAGMITAAAFLAEFVGDCPWVHLDIAGTAWNEKGRPYLAEGATGAGVRTAIALLERMSHEGREQ
jgi:leucyl aminopeptidase